MKNIVLGFVALVLLAVAAFAVQAALFLRSSPSTDSGELIFEVKPNQSFKTVAGNLEAQGLVTSAAKLSLLARVDGSAGRVRVGEYLMKKDLLPRQVLQVITSGKSIERAITISEGLNLFEIAEYLERQGFGTRDEVLRLVRDPAFIRETLGDSQPSLEGYLFPETYNVTKYTGLKGLIRMMVSRFLAVYKEVPEHTMSRHQLVTLASIIEKETGAPEERPIISSVFHNRLNQKMRLQTDPTVIYGLFVGTGTWNRNISKKDLLTDHPYNTYTRSGLPPGPISNPGRDALIAAAKPATTQFLFFVSKNDGTHTFTKSYKDHERAVSQFQLDRKAREGKSWRDLKKRQQAPTRTATSK